MRIQLHHIIKESATRFSDRPAVTHKSDTWSYEELWKQVRLFGAGLARLGLKRGDRVGVYLDKRLETVAAIFGASVAAGAFVPVNSLLKPKQVAYILENCNCRFLVTTAERVALLRDELSSLPSIEAVIVIGTVEVGEQPFQVLRWSEVLSGPARETLSEGRIVDHDMAAILYTSGSTGMPKGVVLSHRNLIAGAESVASYLENSSSDVILSVLPLSFDAGFSQLTTAFHSGAHVILANFLVADDVVKLCAHHKVTGMTAVPPLWIQLVEKNWPREASESMRYIANTGGRMPKPVLDSLRSIFPGAKPYLMYGLTEAFRSTYLDPAEVHRRPDSIGKAIPNAEILVVRPDGTLCAPGEKGELVHRGALVAMGYWNDPERTAKRFRPSPARPEGLCVTETAVWSGDVVYRDEEGFLYFVGRNDEMIKTSGYRVSPHEVEEVAYETGLVRDAVAVGVNDSRIGQSIVLLVCAAKGMQVEPDALLTEFRRRVPLFMVPGQIVFRESLPRLPSGKFDRAALREEFKQLASCHLAGNE